MGTGTERGLFYFSLSLFNPGWVGATRPVPYTRPSPFTPPSAPSPPPHEEAGRASSFLHIHAPPLLLLPHLPQLLPLNL